MSEKNSVSSENLNNNVEKLNKLSKTKAFLGREFLTWLWFKSETSKELLRINRQKSSLPDLLVDFWIDDRMFLQPFDKQGHDNILRGGDPSRSEEASASLASGKVVKELKLGMNIQNYGDFTAVLNAEDLNPKSLQLPQTPSAEAHHEDDDLLSHEILLKRIIDTEIFVEALDGLFAAFLHERTRETWKKNELKLMKNWISGRQRTNKSKRITH